jgi:thioredoxin-like negative regulator of GroEL
VQQGGRAQGGSLTEKEFALGVEAREHAGALRESYKSHLGLPEVGRALGIEAALGTSLGALRGESLESLRAGVAGSPRDASAHLRLAQALLGVGSGVEAMEVGLEGLRLAKTGGKGGSGGEDVVGATRACVLAAFEVLGPEHERVVAGRKALSKLLF